MSQERAGLTGAVPLPEGVPDPVWERVRACARRAVRDEPGMSGFLEATVLSHDSLEAMLATRLAGKLGDETLPPARLCSLFGSILAESGAIRAAIRADIGAVTDRDPACIGDPLRPVLFFKGFLALQGYRLAHFLWHNGRRMAAWFLQERISEVFVVDIHPAARIGQGVMLDHGHGIVIGETTVVEDDVSILQEVTLGGSGKERGRRHPRVCRGVLVGAGAKILGNIRIGANAKIAAGSVVLASVPAGCTAAGVPAQLVGRCREMYPSHEMNHQLAVSGGEEGEAVEAAPAEPQPRPVTLDRTGSSGVS